MKKTTKKKTTKKKVKFIELPKSQLWVVEHRGEKKKRRIYIYADLWFDVRATTATKLETQGDFSQLFISAVMRSIDIMSKGLPIYEIRYTGSASSNTLERQVIQIQ